MDPGSCDRRGGATLLVMLSCMSRLRIALLCIVFFAVAALPAATSAGTISPLIKGEEVGYFGTGLMAHHLSVFVYSGSQPRRTRVRVCVKGVCKTAIGHAGRTAWYSASFTTRPLPMGAHVTFSATVSSRAKRATTKVTKPLLCMHNNGSTPQTS
jgi:hypothetical protein